MKILTLLLLALLSTQAYALDPQKCFKVTHDTGLLRKYDFPGYSSSEYMTKKYGTTQGTSEASSQSSTGSIDPGVTTGNFISTSQFSSSDGGCSYYSYNREALKTYLASYRELILEQIAEGHGEHLRSIYYYSSCSNGGLDEFQHKLQSRFSTINAEETPEAMIGELDDVIRRSVILSGICQLG